MSMGPARPPEGAPRQTVAGYWIAVRRASGAPWPAARPRLVAQAVAACVLLLALAPAGPPPTAAAQTPPVWPAPEIVANLRAMLTGFYDQEATEATPIAHLTPIIEPDKTASAKDPDTLWEEYARVSRGIVGLT